MEVAGATGDDRPVILITTVDIGGGRSDKIQLKLGDRPEDAARAFCELHSIPDTVVGPLTEHINEHLRKANEKPDASENVGKIAAQLQQCLEEQEEEEEEDEPAAQPGGDSTLASMEAGELRPQKLSFADPSDKLYAQLSSKLLPVDDNSRLLSVSASLGQGPLSNRGPASNRASMSVASEKEYRKSQSADTSPRVHNRLYKQAVDLRHKQEAKRRQMASEVAASMNMPRSSMSWISQEMMKDRSCGPFDNYGEMLYAEGLEAAATRKAKAAAVRAERAARELEGATFTPEITRLAAALWAGDDVSSQPAWQRLSTTKKNKTLERIREMKTHREQAELKECTFQPRINRHSTAMMAERTQAQQALNLSTHEQLFADAVRRQQKMEALQSWLPEDATFMPAINKTSATEAAMRRSLEAMAARNAGRTSAGALGLSQDGSLAGSEVGRATVVDRLYVSMEKTKAKLEEKRAVLYGDYDPATGRTLYQPEVGRAPRAAPRNREGLPIGDYLYVAGLEALSKKEALLEAERQAEREQASKSHATVVSQKLYDRLRAKRFGQIFDYLDTACSGVLDVVELVRNPTAHMDNLDTEVREDVEAAAAVHAEKCGIPLLHEPGMVMLSPDTPLPALPPAPPVDLAAFSALMEEALSRRRKPRSYLVPSPSSKQSPNHTFQPAINKRSKEMAARLRPADLAAHEVLHHTAEAMRSKLEAARREAEAASMADCTFAPRVNPSVNNGQPVEGRALRAARNLIAQGGGAHRPGGSNGSNTVASSGPNSATTSPGMSAAPAPAVLAPSSFTSSAVGSGVPTGRAGSGRAGYAAAMANLQDQAAQQQEQFAALEAEVQQALQGVDLAQTRLGALEQRAGSTTAATVPGAAAVRASRAADASRATEAMLLDMLTSSPQSLDSTADHMVIDQLHRFLMAEAQQTTASVPPVPVPAGAAHISTGGRRTSKDPTLNTATLFVVPSAVAPQGAPDAAPPASSE